MNDREVPSVRRRRKLRSLFVGAVVVALLPALASSNTSRASTSHDDQAPIANNAPVDLPYAQTLGPDLCALLKQVAGSEPVNLAPGVGKPGADYQCVANLRNHAYMTLTNFGVEQSRVHVDLDKSRSGGWVPNALGDPGYGYEVPAYYSDTYGWTPLFLMYARGCYFVQGDGGKDPNTHKPADQPSIPAMASALDSALQQAPYSACGAAPQSDLDLCALMKTALGIEDGTLDPGVGAPSATGQCYIHARGEYPLIEETFVRNFYSPEAARKFVDDALTSAIPIYGKQVWQPTGAFGDLGYGYEVPDSPEAKSPGLMFARGCYVALGYVATDRETGKPVASTVLRKVLTAVDQGLQQPPYNACGRDLDLTIDHMEVVQTIQTQGNDIRLVAGKKAVVRVFPRASGRAPGGGVLSNVRASLFFWPEGGKEVELKPEGSGTVNLMPGDGPNREKTEGSINFVIPPEQAASGAFSLRVVVNPERVIEEKSYENNEIVEPFEFIQRNGLRVGYVRIGYKPPFESTFSWPKTPDLTKYAPLLKKLLPAPDAGVQYYELPWRVRATRSASSSELGTDLNLYLREFYEQLKSDRPDILIGWLDSQYSAGFEYGGIAESATPGLLGRVALVLDYQSAYSEESLAHEIGHDLGLKHTATTGDPIPPCRLSENGDPGYWPSEYKNSAALTEVGFDTVSMKVVPSSHYDFMSYCYPDVWITPFHYRTLFDQNVKPAQEYKGDTIDYILTRGWGWVRGGGGAPRFELVRPPDADPGGNASPALSGSNRAAGGFDLNFADSFLFAGAEKRVAFQSEGTGNYCMRFLDASGQALYERCFEPNFVDQESLEPIEETGFVLSVPDPGAFVRVAIIHKEGGAEREITAIQASAPPVVTIASPKAGDRWEGEHTISWSGTDADGDELRYDIQYSPDGKKTWYPLEVRSNETSYTFSTDEILPSDQTYIRVMASDGFDTTHADVGPLVVPKQLNSPEPPPPPPGSETVAGPGTTVSPVSTPDSSLLYIIGGGALLVIAAGIGMFVVMGVGRRRLAAQTAPPYQNAPQYPPQNLPQQNPPQQYPPTQYPPQQMPPYQGYAQAPTQPLPRRGSSVPLILFLLLVVVGVGVAAGFFFLGWKLPAIGGNSSSSGGGITQPTVVTGGLASRQYQLSLDDLPVGEPSIKDAIEGSDGVVGYLRLEARPYEDPDGDGESSQAVAMQIAIQGAQNEIGTEMWLVTSQEMVDDAQELVSGTSTSNARVELAQEGKSYEVTSPEGWLLKVTVNSMVLDENAALTDGSESPHPVFTELDLGVELTPR